MIPDSRFPIPDSGFPNSEFRMGYGGFGIPHHEVRGPRGAWAGCNGVGHGMSNTNSGVGHGMSDGSNPGEVLNRK